MRLKSLGVGMRRRRLQNRSRCGSHLRRRRRPSRLLSRVSSTLPLEHGTFVLQSEWRPSLSLTRSKEGNASLKSSRQRRTERAASQFSQVHHMQEGRKCSGVARDRKVRNHGVCRRRVVWPSVPRALDRASARLPRDRHHQAHSRRLPSDPQLSSSPCV